MAPHVYARLSGFGWTLLPLAPFWFERVPGRPRSVLARHESPAGPRQATVSLDGVRPAAELVPGTTDLAEVLDLLEGPGLDRWRVETTVFTCLWPEGFALASASSPGPPFDLHGPGESLVFVQGPLAVARLPPLAGVAGQTVRRQGRSSLGDWVELEYQHGGLPWRQTHRVVEDGQGYALVVSAQSPEAWAGLTDAAAEEVASSLAPYRGD
jgi:hypothetical protein